MSPVEPLEDYLRRPNRRRLERIVREYHQFVWQLAFRATRDREDASDICQDVFLKLLLKPPGVESCTTAKGYLCWRVLSAQSHMRRSARRRAKRELEHARRYAEVEISAEDLEALISAIDELPDDLHTAVELRYFTGLSARAIAEILEISEQAVGHWALS